MAHVTVEDVLRSLRDVDFPAGKDELIRAAQEAGAPEEVIHALRAIPPEVYRSRTEVARSVPADPDLELGISPGQRFQQARVVRHHGPRGLSERMKEVPKPAVEEALEEEEDLDDE